MKEKAILDDNIDVSIIVPCKNEGGNLKWTIDSLMKSQNILKYEIIVVDDGSIDGGSEFLKGQLYKKITLIKTNSIGAGQARNIGVEASKGKYVIFCDAHIKVPHRWLDGLINTLKTFNGDIVTPCITDIYNPLAAAYGLTWNKRLSVRWISRKPKMGDEIPFAGAGALCIRKEAFEKIYGFDDLFQVLGAEDQELCLKAWLYGYKIVINPEVKIAHLFNRKRNYKVTSSNIIYNTLSLAYYHFSEIRINKVKKIFMNQMNFPTVQKQIEKNYSQIINRRTLYFNERTYNDDYFFNKFRIHF
ncbi:glycosyltransferase family 2 protein [Oceanirhabdus sp. W0125-5]|uniref:glycosyltransferase family 2 protein n=1 Tax=Oceanirhabdus sp. W0125-5 TaxID=2999116 RepID=UPI0022F312CB|nr:glycosyltransferase [Oceanirhabdus sp. W0125-5]WBW96636.1 glycosyltransferase [Oceanirhabdus sp. W0125-5]